VRGWADSNSGEKGVHHGRRGSPQIPILWSIELVVLIIGLVLLALGAMGRAVGGRKHYY